MAKNSRLEKQRRMIVLLALFLLKYKHGKTNPQKNQVINFVSIHNLIQVRPNDQKTVASEEEAWANALAWTRNRLKDEGFVAKPDSGIWSITPLGEEEILRWLEGAVYATRHMKSNELLAQLSDILREDFIVTPSTFEKAKEAYEIYCDRFPERKNQFPEKFEILSLF
ncbi:MAG: hypothetical protein H7A52_16985 [Akkermansiaceae bacterium]|nr:hypothetical protein [Akkermansiaceae bacterium]